MASRISNTEWGLINGLLIMVDIVQTILDFFVLGLLANRFIDIFIGMALPLYLKMRGVDLDKKKVWSMIGAFFFEMIPVVDALPLWSLDGFIMMGLDKADKKRKLQTEGI